MKKRFLDVISSILSRQGESRSPPVVFRKLQGGRTMSMEVTGLSGPVQYIQPTLVKHQAASTRRELRTNTNEDLRIQVSLAELQQVGDIFNHRLKFTVDERLNEVVVKVIDAKTDKVIKELPPEEIQRLHIRIREAIGLLVDEVI
jgi:flagellar protein FlaG